MPAAPNCTVAQTTVRSTTVVRPIVFVSFILFRRRGDTTTVLVLYDVFCSSYRVELLAIITELHPNTHRMETQKQWLIRKLLWLLSLIAYCPLIKPE